MKSTLLITIIFLLTIGCNQPNESIDNNSFIGLWKMHTIEQLDSLSGEWIEFQWMKGGTGYILYDNTEHMSAIFAPKYYEKSNAKWLAITDSLNANDLSWLAQNYWYMAKYTVDKTKKTVQHERIAHVNPSNWNQIVKRKYEFIGDTLILTPLELNVRLKWIKQKNEIN